jgi:hypothetical protein
LGAFIQCESVISSALLILPIIFMKKFFLTLVVAFASVSASYGQGTVLFNNIGGAGVTNAFLNALQPINPNLFFALYGGSAGTTNPASLVLLGAPTTILFDGAFSGGTRTNTAVAPGANGVFQVRAWDSTYGATYEAFESNLGKPADALTGVSALFTSATGGGTGPVIPAVSLATTFPGMVVVPEPTTYALGALGLGLIWLAKRRRE